MGRFPVTHADALLIRRGYAESVAWLRAMPLPGAGYAADMLQRHCDILYGSGDIEPRGIFSHPPEAP